MTLPIVDPDLNIALNTLKRDIFVNMNCVQVGIIQEFFPESQSASVQIVFKAVTDVLPDGTEILQERPLCVDVPVVILYGGGSYLTFPIAPGDNCLLLFNDRELDQWFENGGVQVPVTDRAHSISDAIALVGLRSLQNSIANYLINGIRLAFSDTSKMDLKEDLIESVATLFKHNGNMEITGDLLVHGNTHVEGGLQVDGIVTGTGGSGAIDINANVTLHSGKTLSGGILQSSNGVTGTFTNSVTVVNGIVTAGT